MEKPASEKALDGSLLSKLVDPRYFIMFTAFGLYWDSYSHLVSGKGLLNLTYTIGDTVPLGITFILIASFSLLASVFSPFLFWIIHRIFWFFWHLLPDKFRPQIGESSDSWGKRFMNSVSKDQLTLWAIKSNSSLAMSLAKENENKETELHKNAPQPFLLAFCICCNYILTQEGILRTAENSLPNEFQGYFVYILFAVVVLLLSIAYSAISDWAGYFYLPGLKEHINKKLD